MKDTLESGSNGAGNVFEEAIEVVMRLDDQMVAMGEGDGKTVVEVELTRYHFIFEMTKAYNYVGSLNFFRGRGVGKQI